MLVALDTANAAPTLERATAIIDEFSGLRMVPSVTTEIARLVRDGSDCRVSSKWPAINRPHLCRRSIASSVLTRFYSNSIVRPLRLH